MFVSNGHSILAEYTSGSLAASPQRIYLYGNRIDEPVAMIDSTDTYYYHADASTSIRAITDSSGSVEELYKYSAYGDPTILAANGTTVRSSSNIDNRFLFTAREWDDALTATSTLQIESY
ncbi:hypothetical protein KOR42_55390 [Thalassoglobus neptunius]|uniref:RHS Repeat protein n=1 Tax=Thalassoglobus neptunius TaxID=1938619 RepID=A0A5C5USV0_9PLAN|nr:hypothetical protein [Thalassoglobus neptunius]TWT29256.1 hypothetical protein KOR42_55390 [Thalassoglobus neptunius]